MSVSLKGTNDFLYKLKKTQKHIYLSVIPKIQIGYNIKTA